MVLTYNTRSVKIMDSIIKEQILKANVPLSVYTDGFTDLGPSNPSALERFANICSDISKYELPLPPSPFIEFVVDRTTGKSKQDFTGTIDGKKGTGKSYTGGYECGRYAIELASRKDWGQDPKDFFSLDNCALLEDSEGISQLMDEAEKYQAILIDDAGIAVGSRDFATQKNKNLNKILTVCRTKRWFLMQNAPLTSQIDLQQRELMDMSGHIYKSFHAAGFNLIRINSIEHKYRNGKKEVYERKYTFYDRKMDFYCAYSPDVLDPFVGFTDKYDKIREEAANALISNVTAQEKARSNPITKQELKRKEAVEQHGETIKRMCSEGISGRKITAATGLSDHMINMVKAELHIK